MLPQVERMKSTTRKWAAQMKAGYLKRHEAWLSLTTMIWKSLKYPLNATTISKKECVAIMEPALTVGLNGIGICQHLPRVLLHGPTRTHNTET